MKGTHNVSKAKVRAKSRDRKRVTKMKVSGKSVFGLAQIKAKPKR